MSESSQYAVYKKKLQGICDEHNLVFRLRVDTYPISLTIKPTSDVEGQMSMLEEVEDKGYISPDATLIFYLQDGNITYKTSQTFTISEALFNKLKNLFKNLYTYWLQFFFRDVIENNRLNNDMPLINEDTADTLPAEAQPIEAYEDADDEADCDLAEMDE